MDRPVSACILTVNAEYNFGSNASINNVTTDKLEIREAIAEDRHAIASIAQEIVDSGTVFVFEDAADVVNYWCQPDASIYVVARGDEILGTYVVKPNQKGRGSHVANAGYMVRRSAMGSGIGTMMGTHSIELAKNLGFEAIQFNMVVATNTAAVHLWKKLGFDIVGELPGVFRHPEHGNVDAFVMYREL